MFGDYKVTLMCLLLELEPHGGKNLFIVTFAIWLGAALGGILGGILGAALGGILGAALGGPLGVTLSGLCALWLSGTLESSGS
jgi:hypothetical protein